MLSIQMRKLLILQGSQQHFGIEEYLWAFDYEHWFPLLERFKDLSTYPLSLASANLLRHPLRR